MGRPWPQSGEELFTQEDTDYAIALAEEERDTCPSCGMPKAWCRDEANKFAFEPVVETCAPAYRLALYRNGDKWKDMQDDDKQAAQLTARFRKGHEPDIAAGLGLGEPDQD